MSIVVVASIVIALVKCIGTVKVPLLTGTGVGVGAGGGVGVVGAGVTF